MEQSALAAHIDEVEHLYQIPEKEQARSFLAAHPELVDILIEARPHIERQFGRDAVVELRFSRHFEGDYERDLLAMVQTPLEADTALDLWDRFSDEWWDEASGRPESWPLYIGVEFR